MSEVRVIKKYPNRRLYDTEVSKYITLEHVHQLVLEQVPFVVQDAKSKADITRSILLQNYAAELSNRFIPQDCPQDYPAELSRRTNAIFT